MRWILLLAVAGCSITTREARAIMPHPTRSPPVGVEADQLAHTDDLPASVPLYIYQRNYQLRRDYQLRNSARFVVVNRDRLRFHVGMVGYEDDTADTSSWTVWLEDETGRHLAPESRDVGKLNRIVVSWRLYPYPPGGTAWCREPPCFSRLEPNQVFEVYEGTADYSFSDPGLGTAKHQLVSLVLRKGRDEYRYTWRFGDGTEVHHYGRTHVDDELGIISVPGPHTEVGGVEYEDGR
jgi:hypothetical protein